MDIQAILTAQNNAMISEIQSLEPTLSEEGGMEKIWKLVSEKHN